MGDDRLAAAVRSDGWSNDLLGMGGTRDPMVGTQYLMGGRLDDVTLEALYVDNHFAARIVEALLRKGLSPGWTYEAAGDPKETDAVREALSDWEESIGLSGLFMRAATWGRLFGGGLMHLVVKERGASTQAPMRLDRVESLDAIHVYDRRSVVVWSTYDDPQHPKFRQPEVFAVYPRVSPGAGRSVSSARSFLLHESRAIVWPGVETTDDRAMYLAGWDDSVLQRAWEALQQVGLDYGAGSLLLGRISQAIFKIPRLWEKVVDPEASAALKTRIEMLNQTRSRAGAMVLDSEEEFENQTQTLSGVSDLIDRSIARLASAGETTVSVLMGQGVDAASEGDLELEAERAGHWQDMVLRPRHRRVIEVWSAATGIAFPGGWKITYGPTRTTTPRADSERRKLDAETDAINIDKGVYTADVAAQRYGPRGAAGVVLDADELARRVERRLALANQPPKDNAELGTVGARVAATMSIVTGVVTGRIPRDSGLIMLRELLRLTDELAQEMLPEGVVLLSGNVEDPDVIYGSGAGAPPHAPGFNDGSQGGSVPGFEGIEK